MRRDLLNHPESSMPSLAPTPAKSKWQFAGRFSTITFSTGSASSCRLRDDTCKKDFWFVSKNTARSSCAMTRWACSSRARKQNPELEKKPRLLATAPKPAVGKSLSFHLVACDLHTGRFCRRGTVARLLSTARTTAHTAAGMPNSAIRSKIKTCEDCQ